MAWGIPVAIHNHSFPTIQTLAPEDSWHAPGVTQNTVPQFTVNGSIKKLVVTYGSKKTKDRQYADNVVYKVQNVEASQKPHKYSHVFQLFFPGYNKAYIIAPQTLSIQGQQQFLPLHPMYQPLTSKTDPIVITAATSNYPSDSFTNRLIKSLEDNVEELKPHPQVTELSGEHAQSEVSMPETKKVSIHLGGILARLKDTFEITPKELNADSLEKYNNSPFSINVPTSIARLLESIANIEKAGDENTKSLNHESQQSLLKHYLALSEQLSDFKLTLINHKSVQSKIDIQHITSFLIVFDELKGQIKVKQDTLNAENNHSLLDTTLSDDENEFEDCVEWPEDIASSTTQSQDPHMYFGMLNVPEGFNEDDYDTDDEREEPEEPEEPAEAPRNNDGWRLRGLLSLGTIGLLSYLSRSSFTQGTSNTVDVIDINGIEPHNLHEGIKTTNVQDVSCPLEFGPYWGFNDYDALFETTKDVDTSEWEALLGEETRQQSKKRAPKQAIDVNDTFAITFPASHHSYNLSLFQSSPLYIYTHPYASWTSTHLRPAHAPMSHGLSEGPMPIVGSKPLVIGRSAQSNNAQITTRNWQTQSAARPTLKMPTTGNGIISGTSQIEGLKGQPSITRHANSWVVDITADQFALLTPHIGRFVNALTAYGAPDDFRLFDNLVFRWFDPSSNSVFTFDVSEFYSSNSTHFPHSNTTGALQVYGSRAHRNQQCLSVLPSLALVPISAVQQHHLCSVEPTSPYTPSNMTSMVYPIQLPTCPRYKNATTSYRFRSLPTSQNLQNPPTSHSLSEGPIPIFDNDALVTDRSRSQEIGSNHSFSPVTDNKSSDTSAHTNAPSTTISEEEPITSTFIFNAWHGLLGLSATLVLYAGYSYAQHQSRKKRLATYAHTDTAGLDDGSREEFDAFQPSVTELEESPHSKPIKSPNNIDLSDAQLPRANSSHTSAMRQLSPDINTKMAKSQVKNKKIKIKRHLIKKTKPENITQLQESVQGPQSKAKRSIGTQTTLEILVPPPVTNKKQATPLCEINGDAKVEPSAPCLNASLSGYSIFANINSGLKDTNSTVKSSYSHQALFSTEATPILTINYPKETQLTPEQKQSLESDGLTVSSNTGVPYKLIHKENLEPCAILTKEDLSCLTKDTSDDNPQINPEDEYQQRLAMTVMNMIDNVASKSLKMDIKTTDPFAKKIAEKYIAFLKTQEDIDFNETITCSTEDTTQEDLAIVCFDKLITSRVEDVARQNPAIESIKQFQASCRFVKDDDDNNFDASMSKK